MIVIVVITRLDVVPALRGVTFLDSSLVPPLLIGGVRDYDALIYILGEMDVLVCLSSGRAIRWGQKEDSIKGLASVSGYRSPEAVQTVA